MSNDLLARRIDHFVLWSPREPAAAPTLVIGTFQEGAPPQLVNGRRVDLTRVPGVSGLWSVAAADCELSDGQMYHYWFEVDNTLPDHTQMRILVCDPFASTTDWRLYDGDQPPAVVRFAGGTLVPCDTSGVTMVTLDVDPSGLPKNNQMVIYEFPTAWARQPLGGGIERGVGTFRDILAMIEPGVGGANFSDLSVTAPDHAYLLDLGVNALEFLPLADTIFDRQWGYGTSHFAAVDYELGFPDGYSWPTANVDMQRLSASLHRNGIRLIDDVVMGFAREGPYQHISFDEFHIQFAIDNPPNDPDARSSRPGEYRQDWGSRLFRYVHETRTYDPIGGTDQDHAPARAFMYTCLDRWMQDFRLNGLRLDSIETVANWDFVKAFTTRARQSFRNRAMAHGLSESAADARFLSIGEELSMPLALVSGGYVDALWNEEYRRRMRCALLGRNVEGEPSFEWTVRKAIDCKLLGFSDCAQAVIYFGTHDVEGPQKERLYTFFRYANFPDDEIERRVKLAFACLLTSVGIPMFLAGEEFADQNDLFDIDGHVSNNSGKQMDPVNFSRLERPENAWRRRLLETVKRLVKLRTTHPALARNECEFIHVDFTTGRRVMVWKRGVDADPVIVVANFSEFESGWGNEYRINNWPSTPAGRHWREIGQERDVPDSWAGRESLFRWEAKVYALA